MSIVVDKELFKRHLERCLDCKKFKTCPITKMVIQGCAFSDMKKPKKERLAHGQI